MRIVKENLFFIMGFMFSMLVFLISTIAVYINSFCHHCVRITGFPLPFREEFYGNPKFSPEGGFQFSNDFNNFYMWRFIVNALIILFSSIGVGSSLQVLVKKGRGATTHQGN